jgi:hypothetical protein
MEILCQVIVALEGLDGTSGRSNCAFIEEGARMNLRSPSRRGLVNRSAGTCRPFL